MLMDEMDKKVAQLKSTLPAGEKVEVVVLNYYSDFKCLVASESRGKCFVYKAIESEFKLLDEIDISKYLPLSTVTTRPGKTVSIIFDFKKENSGSKFTVLAAFNHKAEKFFSPRDSLGGVDKRCYSETDGYTAWSPIGKEGYQVLDPTGVPVSSFRRAPGISKVGNYYFIFEGSALKVVWDFRRKKKIEFPFDKIAGFCAGQFITDKEGEYALSYASGQLLKLASGQVSACPTVVNPNVFHVNEGSIQISEQLGLLKFNREHYLPEIHSIRPL